MGKTVRDLLVEALENLEKNSLKKFKNKLNDLEIKKGHYKIPRGKLEEADAEDVANLIINYYTDSYGTEVTLTVLEKIPEKQEAEKLRIALGTVRGFASQVLVQEDGGAASRGETASKLPQHWQPMNNSLVMEVGIPSGSQEYSQVQQLFAQTCGNRILKIQRIQNKDLWLNYQIKKQSINAKNMTTTNEKQLFHGTNLNAIQDIKHNGFNRSYAGRHGAMYGNGTYFSVNANCSALGHFAMTDPSGHKHMYLARVLTGQFCVGKQGMVAPPAKNSFNTFDRYDSVTDYMANPTTFIIFNDIQAYPEYHITFC